MAKSDSVQRVQQAADALGLDIEVLTLPVSARTAQLAADGLDCAVGQIVKSLIFRGAESGQLRLLLVAGDHQADLARVAILVGEPLNKADATEVKRHTGFSIGGVAPIGHLEPVPVWMDEALFAHERVWAAAGRPETVFAVSPSALQQATGAVIGRMHD